MKKLLDNNLFVALLIVLQILLLVTGVLVAIYDDGHASVALLFLVIDFLFVFNIIVSLLAVVLNSTKKWYYVGLMLFWVLLFILMFYEDMYTHYDMMNELEEIEQKMEEENFRMQVDSIPFDSIQ